MAWLDEEPVRGGFPSIEVLALPGVDRVRAGIRGLTPAPPIHHLFGLVPVSANLTSSSFTMPASPWLQSGAGVFLAGTSALVADAPLGSAILGPLGPGKIVITSDLSLNFLRPTSVHSGRLNARARPIEVGRRLGLAEATIEDERGDVVAHATTRCFIRDLPYPEEGQLPDLEPITYDTPDPHEREFTGSIVPPEVWREASFLEIFERIQRGELAPPPFAELFGLTDVDAKEGYFESTAPSSAWFASPAGTIYGGFLAYFADSTLIGAMSTVLPADHVCAPLDLKVNFLRPVMPDRRPIVATARVIHRGRTLVLAECDIVNADGKVVVKATSSGTIIEGRTWLPSVIDHSPVT